MDKNIKYPTESKVSATCAAAGQCPLSPACLYKFLFRAFYQVEFQKSLIPEEADITTYFINDD